MFNEQTCTRFTRLVVTMPKIAFMPIYIDFEHWCQYISCSPDQTRLSFQRSKSLLVDFRLLHCPPRFYYGNHEDRSASAVAVAAEEWRVWPMTPGGLQISNSSFFYHFHIQHLFHGDGDANKWRTIIYGDYSNFT